MTLHDLADELAEVRRYVRSQPEYVRDRIKALSEVEIPTPTMRATQELLGRLWFNVDFGLRCYIFNAGEFIAFTNVHVLEGYLDGAVYEVREHARQQEKTK